MPIAKLPQCRDCPLATLSDYITPDALVPDAEVYILGQAPGEHEENGQLIEGYEWSYGHKQERLASVRPQPLIGPTGQWLQREFWPLTKLDYSKVSKANVLKCRPHGKNDLPNIGSNKAVNGISVKQLKAAIEHCTREYLRIPSSTKYILAMGAISLYALTGELKTYTEDEETGEAKTESSGITDWRGWCIGKDLVEGTVLGVHEYYTPMGGSTLYPHLVDVFPTVHIASLFQSQRYYHATLHDFVRFGKLVRGTWPEPLPEIRVNEIPESIPSTIGFDTEYTKYNELTMWSMADVQAHVTVIDAEHSRELRNLPKSLTLVTQNGLVDLPHFMPLISGAMDRGEVRLLMQDCMLAHATLWTGEPNSLDYILSKYGRYNRHKHLRVTDSVDQKHTYAGLDAHTTLNDAWRCLLRDFRADPPSWNEYKLRRQPLLDVIYKFNQKGVATWQQRIDLISRILDKEMQEIDARAKLLTQNSDFNIASWQQVGKALYERDYASQPKTKTSKGAKSSNTKGSVKDTRQIPKERGRKITTQKELSQLITQLKLSLGVE